MAETLTPRLQLIKNDAAELVNINEINSGFDAIDAWKIPAAKMRSTVAQVVAGAGASVVVGFDTIVYDSWTTEAGGAMANVSTDNITAKIDGLYWVTAAIAVTANGSGNRVLNLILNSASTVQRTAQAGSGSNNNHLLINQPISLVTGDVLGLTFSQNSAVNLNILETSVSGAIEGTMFSLTWIGKKPA